MIKEIVIFCDFLYNLPLLGSNSSESTQQYTSTSITTVECNSIDSGINLINSYISKQVNLSHAKVIVISESLAVEGIGDYISSFINNVEVRPDCNIVVSRCSAEDFLNNSKPTLETLSARYYEQVLNSSQYTGYTATTTLFSFYNALKSKTCQPIAILGGINSDSGEEASNVNIPYIELDSSYKANETPIKNATNLENMGLAVFNGDKLVGELNAMNALSHLMCTSQFNSSVVSVPSPFNENGIINLFIKEDGNAKIDVSILNGSPYICINIPIVASVLSMEHDLDLRSEENLKSLEKNAISYLEKNILFYLYLTSKKMHADIADFGKYLLNDYIFIDDWENLDWLNLYPDSTFHVNISIQLTSPYLLVKN